jgi:hypothetical protein
MRAHKSISRVTYDSSCATALLAIILYLSVAHYILCAALLQKCDFKEKSELIMMFRLL